MATVLNHSSRYLDSVSSLPPSPTLVTELLSLFREPDKEIDQVVELIRFEPSLTAEILRRCNSALFAGTEPASDMFEAVTRLGYYEIYCLVVSLFGARTRAMDGDKAGVNVEELWRHSVMAAVSASAVAEEVREAKSVAFTAGLLHDIGKLVLASVERERYAQLMQLKDACGRSEIEIEQAAFRVDHAEIGGELMARWNLPEDVVFAVRHHHQPLISSQPFDRLAAIVQLADLIAHRLAGESGEASDSSPTTASSLEILELIPDDLDRLTAQAQAGLGRVKHLLEI